MNNTKIFNDISQWQKCRKNIRGTVGFVPTMGALHAGHLSLVKQSLKDNDYTLVSIFVNPTQFDQTSDLENYPTLLENDLKLLQELGVNGVLIPTNEQVYPDKYTFKVTESNNSQILCGNSRPGHFNGVLTVVLKLLNIAQAQRAYFGRKDYQQYLLIKGMAAAFFIPTEIIACDIIRETDGLAMSSRNLRLSPNERKLAPQFFKTLKQSKPPEVLKAELQDKGFHVDYIQEHWGRRFGAVNLGDVRLIDNVEI